MQSNNDIVVENKIIRRKLLEKKLNFTNQKKAARLINLLESAVSNASFELNKLHREIEKLKEHKDATQ